MSENTTTTTTQPKLKSFLMVNTYDGNDSFTVEAIDANEAAIKALDELGYFVSEGEEIEVE